MKLNQEKIEQSVPWLVILVLLVVSVGGLVEIVPLFFQGSTTQPVTGLKPYSPLALTGRDIYVREGCYNCHSQMIRPFRAETERYGPYSVAGEFVYDHPFQWGSKRTGPDLARVGARYSDDWHRVHLNNPRDVVPESNMPGYPWLATTPADAGDDPGQDEDAAHARAAVHGPGDRRRRPRRWRTRRSRTRWSRTCRAWACSCATRGSHGHVDSSAQHHDADHVHHFHRHRVLGIQQEAQEGIRRGRQRAVRLA